MNGTHEIIELNESYDLESKNRGKKQQLGKAINSIENDINKLFEAIGSHSERHVLHKSAMKKPMRGIGISESTSLKQALRGLCISQASEMAALKKRMSNVPNKAYERSGAKNDQDYQIRKLFHKSPHEEWGFSQSSKSSIGEYSSTTSYSEESSYVSRSGYRPHMSKDMRWEAISLVQKREGILGMKNFKLLRKIGGGDIGTVYLSELIGTGCLFAVKVMDNEFLGSRKKMHRAQTEKEILEILDHPFLPTLYVHFMTSKYSCLVMEYCPGGDLHVLRQKQPNRRFTEKAARFYAAEILLALEYLHMLGVVYRDLKPENILVRQDGHIMLSDFDLSLLCTVYPTLSSPISTPTKKTYSISTCMHPFCFTKTPKLITAPVIPLPQLLVEPITARSNSFVGTHEYLAPEIIKGEGHGSPVDWWTFGVFLYELLYGQTPFKGKSNEETIANVVSESLKFPEFSSSSVSSHARDLIFGLLKKEPGTRLGCVKGAAEIKQHSFFAGLNWALIRSETPPIRGGDIKSKVPVDFENGRDEVEFEMF